MNATILSTVLLAWPAALLPSPAPGHAPLQARPGPTSVVDPESGAWAAVEGGVVWVCWTPGPDCFVRLELGEAESRSRAAELELEDPDADDSAMASEPPDLGAARFGADTWRLGFAGPRTLWIEHGDRRWRVDAGQRQARLGGEPPPRVLRRATTHACSPDGWAPIHVSGRWAWREVPRCSAPTLARTCLGPAGPRLRPPSPIRLRVGLELAQTRRWTSVGRAPTIEARRLGLDLGLAVVVELGFDPTRLRGGASESRAVAARVRTPSVRTLPAIVPGPTEHDERAATQAIVCGGRS